MERLPRGRHGLSPDYVARNQRERLVAGLTQALFEVGYQETTVSLIGQKASVSKSDFYRHFESKDDCFVAAYESSIARIRARLADACEGAGRSNWSGRVQSALAALVATFHADPPLASMALVEGLRAGRGVYDRYQVAVDSFVGMLGDGAPPSLLGAPETTGEAVVGGIASLLGRRVLAGETENLFELVPEVVEFALAPYLGVEEARRIVSAR